MLAMLNSSEQEVNSAHIKMLNANSIVGLIFISRMNAYILLSCDNQLEFHAQLSWHKTQATVRSYNRVQSGSERIQKFSFCQPLF